MSLPHMQVPNQSYEMHGGGRGTSGRGGRVSLDQFQSQGGLRISSPVNMKWHVEGDQVPRRVASGKPSMIPGGRSGQPQNSGEGGKHSAVRLHRHDNLSSSGTQVSTDAPLGETSYGPMRIKSNADGRKMKLDSCGSDSLCKFINFRPPSSTGTSRTVGSNAVNKGAWTSQNWVAKDSRSTSSCAIPVFHEDTYLCEENVDSKRQTRFQGQKTHYSASRELTAQESVVQARKGLMDRANMHQPHEVRHKRNESLAISPRNHPVHLDDILDTEKEQSRAFSSKDNHAAKFKDQEAAVEGRHKLVTADLACKPETVKNSPLPKSRLTKPPEWTGLTQNTMELLLKLREEEEVRQLRQRAVARWLNHLPSPPKKYRGIPNAPQDEEGSCTSIDMDTDLDSLHDFPLTPRKHYKNTDSAQHDKQNSRSIESPLSSEMQTCRKKDEPPVSESQNCHGDFKTIKTPEFEFVDYCGEDGQSGAWNHRVSCSNPGSKAGGLNKGREAFEGHQDCELVHAMSDAAFRDVHACELHAIPEVGSASDALGDVNHDAGSQRPTSTVEATAEVFSNNSESTSDEPIRHPRDAACNWQRAMSSVDKWVNAREMVKPSKEEVAPEKSEPDLETAVDAHDNGQSRYDLLQKRAFEDRMGWCLSDDCDSSRIAVGLQSAEGLKSPRSSPQTPKLSTRSSTLSDECAQRFHMKYAIPEGRSSHDKWAADDNCSELMVNSTTDLQSAVGTIPCETLSEVPLPSPRPGTEYRPSGSLVDSMSVDEDCWVKPQENVIPEMVTGSHYPASTGPQATYWLPEFCQNSPVDCSQSTQFHTPRSEPSQWHNNPLSPHYPSREDRNVNHTAGSRKIIRSSSLVASSALQQHYYGKEPQSSEHAYSGSGMPKLSPRQRLWRHVQQVTNRGRNSLYRSGHPGNKRTGSASKCTGLFSAIIRLCSPRE